MAAVSGHGPQNDRKFEFIMASHNTPLIDELAQAKKEIELLKASDPFHAVEMAVEIQVERMRVVEAMNARDAVVQRLSDAYISLRQKSEIIERLQQAQNRDGYPVGTAAPYQSEPPKLEQIVEMTKLKEDLTALENIIKDLREEIRSLKAQPPNKIKSPDPPPRYEEGASKSDTPDNLMHNQPRIPFRVLREPSSTPSHSPHGMATSILSEATIKNSPSEPDYRIVHAKSDEPEDMIQARYDMLAAIPLPAEPPDDTLKPIIIPPPFTLHEFLANASGSLRTSLSNYRVLPGQTTLWCPEREEHGYFYTPIYKCSTNPRVTTAHRWSSVDVIARMSSPTECFYNKDGTWYYAGIYTAFRLDDLSTKEWAALSSETTQSIIKETISGRKNTSPQNIYETSQLYAAGALKVACVGLQCVGFNQTMYKAILDQASKLAQSKWKGITGVSPVGGGPPGGGGIGSGAAWNTASGQGGDLLDGMGAMNLGGKMAGGIENVPVDGVVRGKR